MTDDESDDVADRLHRTVKLAIDTGEAKTVEEAERIFAGYRLQIVVGPEVADSVVLQAAVLTAVNCAARTLLGGVTVVGALGRCGWRCRRSTTSRPRSRLWEGAPRSPPIRPCRH